MKDQLNRPAVRAFLVASLTFLSTAVAPALGKSLAEQLNLFIQLLDPLLIGAIGTLMSVIVFLDNFFRRSKPALSGVLGALNNLVGLIYLLVFAEMLTSINIPVMQILYSSLTFVTINYQPVISLAIIAFATRMLRHSYQILFHEQLKETL
ncbi:MAG: hypothetical protein QXW47_07760 [Candidatus Jordarchaeales archaeon]|nr:hypothetical protein [Candidatus Jordarchaeia archaeon]